MLHQPADHTGEILIAAPMLMDPGFHKTLILNIKQESDGGVMGVILNRITPHTVKTYWADIDATEGDCLTDNFVHVGGPVASSIIAVHTIPIYGEHEITKDLYFSVEHHNLGPLVGIKDDPYIAYFLGYAGWSPHQLDYEMSTGAWLRAKFDKKYIFQSGEWNARIWDEAIQDYGDEFLREVCGVRHFPKDRNSN